MALFLNLQQRDVDHISNELVQCWIIGLERRCDDDEVMLSVFGCRLTY